MTRPPVDDITKVARAIYEANTNRPWENAIQAVQDRYVRMAEAAIASLPTGKVTPERVKAALRAYRAVDTYRNVDGSYDVHKGMRLAIEAALSITESDK